MVTRKGHAYPGDFADAVWGGREQALVAAQRFRDELLLRIGPDTRVRRRIPKGTRRGTGVVGVTLEPHVVAGRVYERYVARWQDPESGSQRRRFLVEHYGKEQAFALAKKARIAGVAHSHAAELARQCIGARQRLRSARPMPRQVKDPLDRIGISMARRRPRCAK